MASHGRLPWQLTENRGSYGILRSLHLGELARGYASCSRCFLSHFALEIRLAYPPMAHCPMQYSLKASLNVIIYWGSKGYIFPPYLKSSGLSAETRVSPEANEAEYAL